jgi:hypothetical protein
MSKSFLTFIVMTLGVVIYIVISANNKWDSRCAEMGGNAQVRGVCYVRETGEIKGMALSRRDNRQPEDKTIPLH